MKPITYKKCVVCGKQIKVRGNHVTKTCPGLCRETYRLNRIKEVSRVRIEAKKEKLHPKRKANQLDEDAAMARSLGLDYGTYRGYVDSGYIAQYVRIHFHQDTEREADSVIVEKSYIGNAHGNHK